jgi:hypothetical protein
MPAGFAFTRYGKASPTSTWLTSAAISAAVTSQRMIRVLRL